MSIWDDPEIKTGGEFVQFENVGDTISGIVNAIRAHRWADGQVSPQILLTTDDGEERTLTAGQIRLKAALVEQRPEAGDHIKVTLTEVEKRSGGKTLKHFDVEVSRGGAVAASAQPAQPVAVDANAAAAALANLTPEQKKALGIPA